LTAAQAAKEQDMADGQEQQTAELTATAFMAVLQLDMVNHVLMGVLDQMRRVGIEGAPPVAIAKAMQEISAGRAQVMRDAASKITIAHTMPPKARG
jgi:hypothetical protein